MNIRRTFFNLLILILSGLAASVICACESKGNSMNKPLVYLIPEEYIGPVFVFFGQSDGIETLPDPLGNAVIVPANGVIKLKASATVLINNDVKDKRNIYWIKVLRSGERKIMLVSNNTSVAENGGSVDSYYDEQGILHRHSMKGSVDPFYYFNSDQKKERMIFEHGSCKHQKFSAPNEPESNWPACGKFLVISTNEYFKKPAWLWDETSEDYNSIQELEAEANGRALKAQSLTK